MSPNPSLLPEIGPDGLPREAPMIAYTEKIIEEEQLQLKKYIEENYSKIRDVERELAKLSLEMKLTAGPKKAALEHLRKKIEISTEKIHILKLSEQHSRKEWEVAARAVKDEENIKQMLCEDLNKLVQESSNSQFSRLEELKRRLEALNLGNASRSTLPEMRPAENSKLSGASSTQTDERGSEPSGNTPVAGDDAISVVSGLNQQGKGKKRAVVEGKGRGVGALPKGRGSAAPGWTGAGFDVGSVT